MLGLVGLQPQARRPLAGVGLGVAAGIVVELALGPGGLRQRLVAPGQQVGARLLEVEAGVGEAARAHLGAGVPLDRRGRARAGPAPTWGSRALARTAGLAS